MKKTIVILIAASAAMLLTGCMSREETEALSAWTMERYTAQAMAVQKSAALREERDEIEIAEATETVSAPVPVSTPEEAEAGRQEVMPEKAEPREVELQKPLPVMEMVGNQAASEPNPTPAAKAESATAPAEPTLFPEIDRPYPQITCPSEPTQAPKIEWPYPAITCPPEPTPTPDIPAPPEPDPTPVPTPVPPEPDPTPMPTPEPKPVETPPAMPEPTPTPAGGYAVCSCGATLTPDELTGHMKAHAMNGENHSYIAY